MLTGEFAPAYQPHDGAMGGVQSMDEKRISSAAKKVRGSITEALGKLTGDKTTEKKGAEQKEEAEAELTENKSELSASRKNSAL